MSPLVVDALHMLGPDMLGTSTLPLTVEVLKLLGDFTVPFISPLTVLRSYIFASKLCSFISPLVAVTCAVVRFGI